MFGGKSAVVIPNGIAIDAYTEAEIRAAAARFPVSIEPPYLLFVGSMDYHANIDGVIWFVSTAWPALRSRFAGLKLVVAGRDPSPKVRALQGPDIIVTGTVSDVRPYYARASAVLAPLRVGSGTRLKILEAMAAEVPVISTRLGAEGIDITPGRNILLADTPEQLIDATGQVLSRPESGKSLAAAAKQLVEQSYDWSMLGERLFAVHAEVIESRQARSSPAASVS